MVAGGPIVEGILVERFANEKTLAEGSVDKDTVNKKLEVYSILFILLEVETYGKLHIEVVHCFFYFSSSDNLELNCMVLIH